MQFSFFSFTLVIVGVFLLEKETSLKIRFSMPHPLSAILSNVPHRRHCPFDYFINNYYYTVFRRDDEPLAFLLSCSTLAGRAIIFFEDVGLRIFLRTRFGLLSSVILRSVDSIIDVKEKFTMIV